MTELTLNPRQLVALYLSIQESSREYVPEISRVSEKLSRILCERLSIRQFEELESLYEKGYDFKELD